MSDLTKFHILLAHYIECEFAPDVLDGNNLMGGVK